MTHRLKPILLALVLLAGCSPREKAPETLPAAAAEALLEQAGKDLQNQHYDQAMEGALQALEAARAGQDRLLETKALTRIVSIDIMTSRDDDAWAKAAEAEALARAGGFREELAAVLIAKAKLCSYAEISPETGRNDEGLDYAREALELAEAMDQPELQCEACYVIGSLYINKNRWADPIDPELYRTAGEYLDKGQALAESYDLPRLRRNGLLFRSRWFQQGDRNQEAIDYFTSVLQGLKESDHLTAASLQDRLVRLYTRTGNEEMALEAHESYVFHMQKYMEQKADETLQEMETRFEVQEKEREIERRGFRITILALVLALAALVILLGWGQIRRIRRRNAELSRISDSREQIIEFLSKDLRNPASEIAGEIAALSAQATTLSPEEIRRRCETLAAGAESINSEVARYVGDVLIDRSRRIADIGLSAREIQIIRLSAEGLTAAQIAERSFLSVHTVNTHRQRIYAKMDVRNVSDMLRKATELGII